MSQTFYTLEQNKSKFAFVFSYNRNSSSRKFLLKNILFSFFQALYDSAVQYEASSDWVRVAEKWKACVNETLRQMEECRVQCVVASQRLPEDRGVDSVDGAFEKAAG